MEEYIIFVCSFLVLLFKVAGLICLVFPVGFVSFLFGCLIPNLKALKSWIDGVRAAAF